MRTKPLQTYFTARNGQDEELRSGACDGYSQCEKLNEYSQCDGYSDSEFVCQFASVCQFADRISKQDSLPLDVHSIHFVAI